jgi:hypothetical protein
MGVSPSPLRRWLWARGSRNDDPRVTSSDNSGLERPFAAGGPSHGCARSDRSSANRLLSRKDAGNCPRRQCRGALDTNPQLGLAAVHDCEIHGRIATHKGYQRKRHQGHGRSRVAGTSHTPILMPGTALVWPRPLAFAGARGRPGTAAQERDSARSSTQKSRGRPMPNDERADGVGTCG